MVSVIVCTRNRSALLKRCLESVFLQEGVSLEVIVVDDFSEPEEREAVRKVCQGYSSRLDLLELDFRRGVATATNLGFQLARGKYIALLGDDDFWSVPTKLKRQVEVMESASRLGVIGSYWVTDTGSETVIHRPTVGADIRTRVLMGGGIICGSAAVVRRSVWEELGGLDEQLQRGTDSDLFRRIELAGYKLAVLPEVTTWVDAKPGRSRMTSIDSLEAISIASRTHSYILRRYAFQYLLHPKAFFFRAWQILRLGKARLLILSKRLGGRDVNPI